MTDERLVVVTGGAKGIGEAVVDLFSQKGWNVVVFDRDERTLSEQPKRESVTNIALDVSDAVAVKRAFGSLRMMDCSYFALINNAGIQKVASINEMSTEAWESVIGTNLTGAFICASEAIRSIRMQGIRGSVVNVASVAAFLGLPGRVPYCSAKAGLLGLTRSLSVEVAGDDIRVNAVAPGFTRTDLIAQGLEDGSLREDWMLERIPMRRLAKPFEIAEAVYFLASDVASYITGQCLIVDGGWSVQGINNRPEWLAM